MQGMSAPNSLLIYNGGMYDTRPRWSSTTKVIVILLLLGLSIYLLYRFTEALRPSILAALLAYGLTPVANWFEERFKLRRGLATMFTYLLLLVCLTGILMVVIPQLTAQIATLNLDIKNFFSSLEGLIGREYIFFGQTIDGEALYREAADAISGLIEPFVGQTLSFVVEVLSSAVWAIFVLVVSFYLVKDGSKLRQWFGDMTPPMYRADIARLRVEINQIWGAFFRGQLNLALIVATIFIVIGLIIGLPFALVMGILAGLLEFLPSIGHGIWLSIAVLLTLFSGSTWLPIPNWVVTLIVVGLHVFFQQFDLNYLIPRIIGRQVHLPPLVVILGIVTGALLAGVLGILLAAPTIASARVVGRYIYANLFDQDPFPGSMAPPLPPPNPRWWRKSRSSPYFYSMEKQDHDRSDS